MNSKAIGIIGVVAVAAIGAAIWYTQQPAAPVAPPQPVPAPVTPAPTPDTGAVTRAAPPLPPPDVPPPAALEGSDDAVHAAVANFGPQLQQWLTPKDQVRKWVTLVDQIADGTVPVEQRPLTYKLKPFAVAREGDALVPDKTNYTRATALIDALTAIPPERLAAYYRGWRPLLEKAQKELGGDKSFDNRLRAALQRIVAVRPLPDKQPALEQPSVYYTYADPRYEKAGAVDKFMWRLGPDNSKRLQAYVNKLLPLL